MEMQKRGKRIICMILVVVLSFTMMSMDTITALAKVTVNGYTDPADKDVVRVVSAKNYELVPGVIETDIVLNDQTGDAQVMAYMTSISKDADVTLKATYAGYYSDYSKETNTSAWEVGDWGLSTTTVQANQYEVATGENVIFATNGDYFNMQSGQPIGPLFMNGVNCNPDKTAAEPFFAVLKDGSMVIRNAGAKTSDVAEAVGSPFYLVKNGKNVCNPGFTTLYPVNSVGFKADGTLVFFMADGRQYPKSVGMSQYEMAQFLIAQGVVTALYLDGGGSATVITQREGEDKLAVRNSPSDGGERSISSGFLLVANAKSDGIFDHASLLPNNENYTPGSEVEFSASGVDAAGGAAQLPDTDISWRLADDSRKMGSIDSQTGVFTSNGKLGEVTVEMLYREEVVGTTSIFIAEPDAIYFSAETASLDFGEASDLGLVVRANSADLHYKAGDLEWSFSDEVLGKMDGNTFIASTCGSTLKGTVSVSYTREDGKVLSASIEVEIGKMPVVSFDFEPVDGKPQTAAHYHWGKWAPGYTGNVSPITVCTANQYKAGTNPTYAERTAPYVFTGNYEAQVPAADIFRANGYTYYLWPNATITAENVGSVSCVSAEEGGQVRYGNYAMELNYDYKSYDGSKNANYYIRYCGEPYYIEGQPNQLGVWVYADASSKGYMLCADIAVWNGTNYTTKNIFLSHGDSDSAVIDWEGWMYCKGDLSSLASFYSVEHPYAILPGFGLFWLSYQPAKQGTNRSAGTIYFDNYRFVYGTDLDDLDSPVVTDIAVNDILTSADENITVYTNDVEITANYYDPDGNNASGINASMTEIRVDNEVVACDSDDSTAITRLTLPNGLHSVQVTAYDCFGNSSTKTRYFMIQDETETATAVLTGADVVTMGSDYELTLKTTGTVSTVEMSVLQVNSDFGEPTYVFEEGWTGDVVYTTTGFKKAKIEIRANWTGEGVAPADANVLTLRFNVPATLDPEMDFFTYQVTAVKCTLPDGTVTTAAQPKVKLALSAYYTVNAGISITGYATELTVVDPEGNAASGVEVFVNNKSIGTTDENGKIMTDVSVGLAAGSKFTVYAKLDKYISFETVVTVMADAGYAEGALPVGVALQASQDGATQQTVSWMSQSSTSLAKAIVEYSEKEDLSNATVVEGISKLHAFNTTKSAARINTVKISGLEPGKTYFYRAGDGNTWSDIKSFTTVSNDEYTRFFVIGDTQMNGNKKTDASEIALLKAISNGVAGYDFGIQTGDYVDNGGNYAMWEELQDVFGTYFDKIDMVHTLGNHEYYGDSDGVAAGDLFGIGTKGYYSVEYDNVYVAVINYNTNLKEALDWLVEDAKASDAAWKILSVHQPPYYTNVNGGSERFNSLVPAAAEAAGINAVFSGHDHSYARTNPMTAGEVDEENGIVYFICGDLGEKSRNINYAATNTEAFHFANINQEYSALYISVEASKAQLSFTVHDADGRVIDMYTMESHEQCASGHTWETYDRTTGMLTCGVCGESVLASEALYTGWVKDLETGNDLYLVAGKPGKGYVRINNVGYYFDAHGMLTYTGLFSDMGDIYYAKDGVCQTGLQLIGDKYYFFSDNDYRAEEGTFVVTVEQSNGLLSEDQEFTFELAKELVKEPDGKIYYYVEGCKTYGGLIIVGDDVYYICSKGYAVTGHVYISFTHAIMKAGYYDFDEDGKMLNVKNGICEENGKKYYYKWNSKYYAGLIYVDGYYYYVASKGNIVTGRYRVNKTNDLMDAGYYDFDEEGRMIIPEEEEIKNGIIEEDGVKYYYVDNKKTYAGLIQIDGDYYYINSKFIVVTGRYRVSKTNGLMDAGYYEFDEDGKMIIPDPEEEVIVKNGIVEEDGIKYYYVNDKKVYAGLIEIDGAYYYVNSKYMVVTGRYRVSKTNGLMEAGYYDFDEDGKMILPEQEVVDETTDDEVIDEASEEIEETVNEETTNDVIIDESSEEVEETVSEEATDDEVIDEASEEVEETVNEEATDDEVIDEASEEIEE